MSVRIRITLAVPEVVVVGERGTVGDVPTGAAGRPPAAPAPRPSTATIGRPA